MISKIIPSMGALKLFKDEEEGSWMLEEYTDIQSYDNYDDAKADYDKVDCVNTLTGVFGWSENPYER